MNIETVKATLDCARADVEAEDDRMKILDGKLSTLATFSGLSVSITASLGANVLVSGDLKNGYLIALGLVLAAAALMLSLTTLSAFKGLRPKEYKGLTLKAARSRVTPTRLAEEPEEALARFASTYYTDLLPAARSANTVKLEKVGQAFRYARFGLVGLIVAILLTAIASVDGKGVANEPPSRRCEIVRGRLFDPRGDREQSRLSHSGGCHGVHREGS